MSGAGYAAIKIYVNKQFYAENYNTQLVNWYRTDLVLGCSYWFFNLISHCIFVVKYWCVSQKIAAFFNHTPCALVERRTRIIFAVLFLWVTTCIVSGCWLQWTFKTRSNDPFVIVTELSVIAPIVYFLVLAHALWSLRSYKDHF